MFNLILVIFFLPDNIIETEYDVLLSDYFGVKGGRCQAGS